MTSAIAGYFFYRYAVKMVYYGASQLAYCDVLNLYAYIYILIFKMQSNNSETSFVLSSHLSPVFIELLLSEHVFIFVISLQALQIIFI
jgi:hypothetical protein